MWIARIYSRKARLNNQPPIPDNRLDDIIQISFNNSFLRHLHVLYYSDPVRRDMWKEAEKDIKPRLVSLMQAQDLGYRPNRRMQFLITDFSATRQ